MSCKLNRFLKNLEQNIIKGMLTNSIYSDLSIGQIFFLKRHKASLLLQGKQLTFVANVFAANDKL